MADTLDKVEKQEIKKEVEKEVNKAVHKRLLEAAKRPAKRIHSEFKQQTSAAIIAAFGFVIALAWKDLITALIPKVARPGLIAQYPYISQLYTAIIITIFAVFGILIISRWAKKPENQ